jgi:hypothetical protein
MRRRGSESDSLSLSFLDAISCGFGAIILLLVIVLVFAPEAARKTRAEVEARIVQLEEELRQIRGETERLSATVTEQAPVDLDLLEKLRADLTRIRGRFAASDRPQPETAEEGELRAARQQLTEEMRRLLADYRPPREDTTVGGIPVDSEYIIFVIDNSGSMQSIWPTVLQKVSETLEVYPRVRGIQVLNNDGRYLLPNTQNRWIPDSPGRRREIIQAMRNWQHLSSSNPTVGILTAVQAFYRPDLKISIYVYGDDFSGGRNRGVEAVIREVEKVNKNTADGQPRVRVHGVAFPGTGSDPARFARFMRALCERNGGTFVALTEADMGPRFEIRTGPFP